MSGRKRAIEESKAVIKQTAQKSRNALGEKKLEGEDSIFLEGCSRCGDKVRMLGNTEKKEGSHTDWTQLGGQIGAEATKKRPTISGHGSHGIIATIIGCQLPTAGEKI